MKPTFTLCILAILSTFAHNFASAKGRVFGLVGKSLDDGNFIEAWRGCDEEAKSSKDNCILLGGKGPADPRFQSAAIDEALKTNRFAAFAVSVTDSGTIAKTLQSAKVPIITFDSPFISKDEHLSRAYVGVNNEEFGRDLARVAKRLRPQGGSICLMTDANDPNLALRVRGVRKELSLNNHFPDDLRLNGEGKWTESKRCPWNSGDKIERSMDEITVTLKNIKPDVFLSVGHWPVVNPKSYRLVTGPFREDLIKKKRIMIVGVGKITPEYAALMDEKLVHGYVSINFKEIGKKSFKLMKAAVEGKAIPPLVYTANMIKIK